jgi:hypothetical protein
MKKPQPDQTNEKAKFQLSAYRPSGADAQDAMFHDALEQASRDPELAKWFEEQRNFDTVIIEKLAKIEPPAGLKRAILAGLETQRVVRPRRFWPLMALAAILTISGMIIYPRYLQEGSYTRTLPGFRDASLAILKDGPRLDLQTSDVRLTEAYIEEKRGPCASSWPAPFQSLATAGCKIFQWKGQPVSLTCFVLPSGELLHAFVMDKKSLQDQEMPAGFAQVNGWNLKMERVEGMLMLFVTRASMNEVQRYI